MMIVDTTESKPEQFIAEKLSDPVFFIETLLRFKGEKFKLYPYQEEIARTTNFLKDRLVFQKGRQVGCSLLTAAIITFAAFTNNDAVFILVSKTAEQSGFIASYVKRFFESNPILAEIIDRKKTRKDDLWLKQGTVIYNRTAGNEGENLRGISCEGGPGAIVFDESAYIPDKAIRALLHVAHGCGEIHCSTPRRPNGMFHSICQSPDYRKFKIPASKSPRIPKNEIERMRRLLKPSEFKTDILGEFSAGENNVFSSEAIEKAINHDAALFDSETFDFGDGFPFTSDPNKNYVYSLDPARSSAADSWCLTIGDYDKVENSMQVVAYHAWSGSCHSDEDVNVTITDDPRKIIADIMQYTKRFHCRKFYADATGESFLPHILLHQYLLPVEEVVFSLQRKERLIENLATVFRAEKLGIPNDSDMVNQLLDFSYDLKRQQNDSDKKIYLRGNADDFPDSLAMLAQQITAEKLSIGGYADAW